MAAANLDPQASAPLDKTVLARYWMFADTDDIELAMRSMQFELDVRAKRDAIGAEQKQRHAELAAEIAEVLKAAAEEKV